MWEKLRSNIYIVIRFKINFQDFYSGRDKNKLKTHSREVIIYALRNTNHSVLSN